MERIKGKKLREKRGRANEEGSNKTKEELNERQNSAIQGKRGC